MFQKSSIIGKENIDSKRLVVDFSPNEWIEVEGKHHSFDEEALFAKKHPTKWIPLYSMVTFSHIDYNDALTIGKKQEEIMKQIMEIGNVDLIWDSQEIQDKILSLL